MSDYKPDLEMYKGINPQKLPRVWFKFYVVYKFSWSESTFILGYNTDVEAHAMQEQILAKPELTRCEIFGHFPRELLED